MRTNYFIVALALLLVPAAATAQDYQFPIAPNTTIPTPPSNGTTIGVVQDCVNSMGQAVHNTSGQCAGYLPIGPRTQLPYCAISLASASNLSGCAAMAQSPTYAVICAYGQAVVWRDDGTAPTATPGTGGQALSASIPGNCMSYTANLANFQAIQQAASAVLGVSFYK